MKVSKIVPVPKVANPQNPSEFRPISVQPNISKLFEKCLFTQLSDHFEANNMISTQQFGFRKNHSTVHACSVLSDLLYTSRDNNMISIVVSLDIMKAFDKVARDILIHKLSWYGVKSDLIRSFLTDRTQFVNIVKSDTSISSSLKKTLLGVPQGSALSNLLFSIMMNDLPDHVKNSIVILFVDDSNLVISGNFDEILVLLEKLEADLENVYKWMNNNRLKLNVSKTRFMIVGSPSQLSSLQYVRIKINGCEIQRVKELKFLGVIFDESLSWSAHTKKVVTSCNRSLFSLKPFSRILSYSNKSILANSLVLSHIKYASVVWLKHSVNNYKSVDSIIKRCGRFVYGLLKYDSVTESICLDLHWLFAKYQYKLDVLKFAYKSINNIVPLYFRDYLSTELVERRTTRHRVYNDPAVPFNGFYGKQCFKYVGSKEIVELPNNILTTQSFFSFKRDVTSFLLSSQFAEYCIPSHDTECCDLSCIDDVIASLTSS